ncbi:hypothetical protein [Cohnella cellulosilytica]|uniref:Uncharacterized protein n=1 Tax=Cohnella cellulosilytica TaxID=986710 RepID=A0ABW2FHF8_9BACL
MNSKLKKRYKIWMVTTVVIVLISQALIFSLGGYNSQQEREVSAQDAGENDRIIAADLSNLTGATSEYILEMRAKGQEWNDILEQLKSADYADNREDKDVRVQQLLEAGISEEGLNRLASEGYTEQEIWNAFLLAERVATQIKELAEGSVVQAPSNPQAITTESKDDEIFLKEIRSVAEKFELEAAVSFMLSLKADFGSYEAVLDEYLAALQLGLDLGEYSRDKEQYEQNKARMSAERIGQVGISLAEIENRVLERIRQKNDEEHESEQSGSIQPIADKEGMNGTVHPLPEVPMPRVEEVKPRNPADVLQDELDRINPNVTISD